MLIKIGWYLLFLLVLVFYLWLVYSLQNKQQQTQKSKMETFLVNQVTILSALIPIVVIPWILGGFFSSSFLLLVLAAFEISSLLNYVLTSKQSGLRSTLWLAELMESPSQPDPDPLRPAETFKALQRSRPLQGVCLFLVLAMMGFVAYFVIVTYSFFAHPLHSDIVLNRILILNFGLYVIQAFLFAALNMAQIASPQIDDPTRRALFLKQAAYALQMGIILTVYLSLMGIRGERFVPQSLVLPSTFITYVPFVVLTAFFMIILVVPYLAGLAGRRRAQIALNRTILKRITTIIDVVGIPGERDRAQLAQLSAEFKRETDTWIESEPMVRDMALKIERAGDDTDQLNKNLKGLVEAYRTFKDQDLRYIRLTWTESVKAKLAEMIEEYDLLASEPNHVENLFTLGASYERFFREEHRDYEAQLKEAEGRRVVAPVLTRVIGVLGAVPVVLQYGQKIFAILPLKR